MQSLSVIPRRCCCVLARRSQVSSISAFRLQSTAAASSRWGTGRIPGRGVVGDLPLKEKELLAISDEARSVIEKDIDPKKLNIEEGGHVYLPVAEYRRILCAAFGIGGWHFIPLTAAEVTPGGGNDPNTVRTLKRSYALVVKETVLAESTEEVQFSGVLQQKVVDVLAQAHNDALGHCCQKLGIADELAEAPFLAAWRTQHAKQVGEVREVDGKEVEKRLWKKL